LGKDNVHDHSHCTVKKPSVVKTSIVCVRRKISIPRILNRAIGVIDIVAPSQPEGEKPYGQKWAVHGPGMCLKALKVLYSCQCLAS